jgi:hypothetical protein
VHVGEDATRTVEAHEQRRAAARAAPREALPPGDAPRAIGQMLGAEQLAAKWSGDELLAPVGRAREQSGKEFWCGGGKVEGHGRSVGKSCTARGAGARGYLWNPAEFSGVFVSAFAVASEMLGTLELTSAQLAQLRALDREYQQRLFALLHRREAAGDSSAGGALEPRPALTPAEAAELRRMLERGILDLLTPEQRATLPGGERRRSDAGGRR